MDKKLTAEMFKWHIIVDKSFGIVISWRLGEMMNCCRTRFACDGLKTVTTSEINGNRETTSNHHFHPANKLQ